MMSRKRINLLFDKSAEASESRDPTLCAIFLEKDNLGLHILMPQSFPSPNVRKMSQFFQEKWMMSNSHCISPLADWLH